MNRSDLEPLVLEAIDAHGGRATIVQINKYIWEKYETQIRRSGDYFYTWQYELRWAGDSLVRRSVIKKGEPKGVWRRI
jgi:hypothetical protein